MTGAISFISERSKHILMSRESNLRELALNPLRHGLSGKATLRDAHAYIRRFKPGQEIKCFSI